MAPKTQTAVEVAQFTDDPNVGVKVNKEKPVPAPGEGQVLVHVKYRPINPSDVFSLKGVYAGFKPASLPAVPGLEGVGVVEALGSGVSRLAVGQRVTGLHSGATKGEGTWQEYQVLDAQALMPVPDAVSDEDASQFYVNPVTAACFLELVPAGKWLLHNTANSVLGKELVAMARHKGVKTLNLVRRKEAVPEVEQSGADAVINISEVDDLPAKIKEIVGPEGVWEAFNPIGGAINTDIVKSLRTGGTCWIYSVMGSHTAEVPMADLLFRDVSVKGFWLGPFLQSLGPERAQQVLQWTMDLMAQGVVRPPPPGKVFPLEQVHEALQAYEQLAGRAGKVLLSS